MSDQEEEGIFPDLPDSSYVDEDINDIAADDSNPTVQLESLDIKTDTEESTTEEEEDDDHISRINIININTLDDEESSNPLPPTPSTRTDLTSLCQALSDISLNQEPQANNEYVEEEDDTEDDKNHTESKPVLNQPADRPAPPCAEPDPTSDPLAQSQLKSAKLEFTQEQVHDILVPYYRTIEAPWNHQTSTEPRITLAAMFKANSRQFQKDSLNQNCSRDSCQLRRYCYWEREWEQRQGRGLYHYTQCVQQ